MTTSFEPAGLALFDLDNTLCDRDAYFAQWAEGFVNAQGLSPDALAALIEHDQHGDTRRDALFTWFVGAFHLTTSVEVILRDYVATHSSHYRLADDVKEALTGLREAKWKIAVVTNGPPEQQLKIDAAHLTDYVDAVCISGVLGVAKPQEEIFHEAARLCGVGTNGWMVGDSPTADIVGGHGSGLRTAWMQREREWPLVHLQPNVIVSTISQAVQVILGD